MKLLNHAIAEWKSRSGSSTDAPSASTASRRLVLLCGVIPAFIAAALALYRPAILTNLDASVYDQLLRWSPAKSPSGRVVIVDVDERSLSTIGQWPWQRELIGLLIARLREMGSTIIAADVIFAEADRSQRLEASERAYAGGPTPDAVLADTLRGGRVILGYAMRFDQGAPEPRACVLHPIGVAIVRPRQDVGDAPLFHATGAVCNLPPLAQAAGASGFLNAAPDSDGILRRAPLLIELEDRVYPGLALAAVAAATGARNAALRVSTVNAASLLLDKRVVPLDGKGNLLLRYRGRKRTFPYVSAADVLNRQVPSETF